MKYSSVIILLLAFCSMGCQKESIGGLGAISIYIPNVIYVSGQVPNAIDIGIETDYNNVLYPHAFSEDSNIELMVEYMEVYDKFGSLIFWNEQFPPNDSANGWHGTVDGKVVEPGSYAYSIKITDGFGSALYANEVTVLR